MKKYLAVLSALLAVFMLAACAQDETPAPASPTVSPDVLASPDVIGEGDTGITGAAGGIGGDAAGGGTAGADAAGGGTAGGDAAGGGTAGGGTAGGGTAGGGMTAGSISGFEEGKQVTESDVPQVSQAVKSKYADAKITGITMSTHEGAQVYHVMLEGADETTDIYVDSQGNIMPYVAGTDAEVVE